MTRNPRPRLRASLSALTLLAVVLTAVSYVLTPARPSHATIASIKPRMQWASEEPLGPNTAFAHTGGTLYVGGEFPKIGNLNPIGLLDLATGQPIYGLPKIAGDVWDSVSDGQGGWFVVGEFAVVSHPGFANLVHIKADRTLDTAWNPRASPGRCLARNTTTLFLGDRAVDIQSGRLLDWRLQGDDPTLVRPCPVVSTSDLVFLSKPGSPSSVVLAADARSGAVRWTVLLGAAGEIFAMALHRSTLYVSGQYPIGLRAIDIPSQRLLPFHPSVGERSCGGSGNCDPHPEVTQLAVLGDTLYFSGSFKQINGQERSGVGAVSLPSGTVLPWKRRLSRIVGASGNRIYLAGQEGAQPLHAWQDFVEAADPLSAATLWYYTDYTAKIWGGSASGAGLLLGGQGLKHTVSGPNLAALDLASGATRDWRPQPNGVVTQLAASDSAVYVAGSFSQIAGQPRPGLAAFDHPGGGLRAWDPQPNGPVNTLLVAHGRLYVTGGFSQIAGQPRPGLAAFDLASGALSDWTPSGLPAGSVTKLAVGGETLYVAVEEQPSAPPSRYNASLVALDRASGAPAGWTATFQVWRLADLATHGNKLFASGSLVEEDSTGTGLLVFDTQAGGAPTAPFYQIATGNAIVIHDQTLYVAESLKIVPIDLDSMTILSWSYESGKYLNKLVDLGSDLLSLTEGRLLAYPYTSLPLVRTLPVSSYTATSAKLSGVLNPNGSPTNTLFQISSQPGNCDAIRTLPVSGVMTGTHDLVVDVTADGLAPNTRYTYRLAAAGALGVSYSAVGQFTTPPLAAADVETQAPIPTTAPSPAPAEATTTPAWQIFLPSMRRCPTDGF